MTAGTIEEALVRIIQSLSDIAGRYTGQVPIGDGRGGYFSLTFRAADARTNESVVLKFLHPAFNGQHPERAFEREVQICKRLVGRDNIVQLRGGPETLVVEMSHPAAPFPIPVPLRYYALEAASGDFESYLLRAKSPSLRRRLEVIRDVVRGVNRLHTAGFCHRDLKPDNILLFRGGGAKLGDLGTCRAMNTDEPPFLSDYHQPPGHILYAAPELLFGGWNSRPLYEGADWFGVGAILFEALTGTNLYTAIGLTNDLPAILRTFGPIPEPARMDIYQKHVQDIAGQYPIPSILGFTASAQHLDDASRATMGVLDTLVRSLCHFDHRRRLRNFTGILRRLDICLAHARLDERRRADSRLRGAGKLIVAPDATSGRT